MNYDEGLERLQTVEEMLDTAPEYQLSEPQGFMTAKAYKTKIAEPLISKLKSLVKTALLAVLRLGTITTGLMLPTLTCIMKTKF